eukprot:4643315-Heterocapsa_arctica.AAC.1
MGAYKPRANVRSLFKDLMSGNIPLAADFYYPHLLRHALSRLLSRQVARRDQQRKGSSLHPRRGG